MNVPAFNAIGKGISKFAPGLNKGPGFRIGISKANLPGIKGTQKVFRATYGTQRDHYFNIILGKWGK